MGDEGFGLRDTGGEEVEHILDADAHAADAGTASTLGGIEGDAVGHADEFSRWTGCGKGDIARRSGSVGTLYA